MTLRRSLSALLLVLAGVLALGDRARAQLPVERLQKGVNLSHWYAQWSSYDEQRLHSYFNQGDVALIAEMGFRHVRLTLSDKVIVDPKDRSSVQTHRLVRLKERIGWLVDKRIAVVVDFHPDEDYKQALSTDASERKALVAVWGKLAGALADTDPAWVALEVMNEPHPLAGEAWRELQLDVLKAMRAAAPRHTLIASPGGWTGVTDLVKFEPYDMPNVVYTFHFYDPHLYTHQSASWGWEVAKRIAGLDWPIDPARAEEVAKQTTTDEEAFGHVKWHIERGRLTREWLADEIAKAVKWGARHKVPIYLGEFGVYTKTAVRAGRLRYYRAVREEAEKQGLGWAIWDYAGGFRVAEGEPGARRADEHMLQALGLK